VVTSVGSTEKQTPKENDMDITPAPRGAVVVGVDGSPTSDMALDWAVEEATRRNLPLHIIHAFSFGYPKTRSGFGHSVDDLRQIAHNVRKEATARAQRANPELAISRDESAYGPATVVVGARGLGAVQGVLVGSVSLQVATHAHCPVVVVHDKPTPAPDAPVVVGVDGSAVSTRAIAYAYEQASSRGVGLTVVHAWWLEYVEGTAASSIWTVDWQQFAEEEQTLVSESLAGWQEKYPDVVVRRHSVRGLPVEALVRQSENACLVVVGTRGRGGFKGLLLGSVSQGVMHRAHCPVAIVHAAKEPPDDREDKSGTAPHGLPVPPVREQT
jgi:nucleotide-binding universal stress UspA family protein